MLIRLYEDCILTPDYEYVVAANSFPEANWEETVAKFSTDIYVDNVCYATDNEHAGQFIVEVNQQVSDTPIYTRVNYCQMYPYVNLGQPTKDAFCINCFITDVSIYNNIVTFKFLEDIFMNYLYRTHSNNSDVPKLNNVLITQKTFLNVPSNANNVRLPVDPYSNKAPVLKQINQNQYVALALKIQRYKTGQAGEVNSRESLTVLCVNSDGTTINSILTYYSIETLLDDLNKILKAQATTNALSGEYNFNIAQIICIPVDMYAQDIRSFANFEQGYYVKDEDNINVAYFCEFVKNPDPNNLIWFKSINIFDNLTNDNDKFYVTGVGFLSKIIPFSYNGKNVEIKLGLSTDNFDITFYMGVNGNLYDVTECFSIDIPYDYQNAEALQLQALKRNLNSNNIELTNEYLRDSMITNMITSAGRGGGSLANALSDKSIVGVFASVVGTAGEIANSAITYEYRTDQLINEKKLNNAPLFSSSTIASVYNTSIFSILVGFIIQTIDPENTDLINTMIDQFGYKCVEYHNIFTLEDVPLKNGRGFVQIEYCEIAGPKIITDVIKRVLKKGAKVIGYHEV